MTFANLAGYVATGVVSLVVGILLVHWRPKARLVYWSPHSFMFNLVRENVVLQTDAMTVQNLGRKPAEVVEIIFGSEPDFFQFQPAINYTRSETPEGYFLISIDSLGPKEFFTLQVLSYTQVPTFLGLRSRQGPAERMAVQVQRSYPPYVNVALALFLIVGFGFTAYWLIRAVSLISGMIL